MPCGRSWSREVVAISIAVGFVGLNVSEKRLVSSEDDSELIGDKPSGVSQHGTMLLLMLQAPGFFYSPK